jgi:hypothetical protein
VNEDGRLHNNESVKCCMNDKGIRALLHPKSKRVNLRHEMEI